MFTIQINPNQVIKKTSNSIIMPIITTITFCDRGENHVGMQMIGKLAKRGFTIAELESAKQKFEAKGYICLLVDLSKHAGQRDVAEAKVLVVRGGIKAFGASGLHGELVDLNWDKKVWMRGAVKNKRARYNLMFSETAQEPDYGAKKGRIIPYADVPLLSAIRDELPLYFGNEAKVLEAEGNKYYDDAKTGIGYHGDSERRKVIGVRTGGSMYLHFQWHLKTKPIGKNVRIHLDGGDMYCMSAAAVGSNWKLRNTPTLRHAAGCAKYTTRTAKLLVDNFKEVEGGAYCVGDAAAKEIKRKRRK